MMKKVFLVIVTLLFTPSFCFAGFGYGNVITGGRVATVAELSCPTDETSLFDISDQTDDFAGVSSSTSYVYLGQGNFDPSTNLGGTARVCAVSVNVRSIIGTGAGDMQIEIYEISSINLGSSPTGTCTSASQTISSTGVTKFTGLDCLLETGKTYGITLTRTDHSYDAANYIQVYTDTAGSESGGCWGWGADKNRADDNSFEFAIKIWGYNP